MKNIQRDEVLLYFRPELTKEGHELFIVSDDATDLSEHMMRYSEMWEDKLRHRVPAKMRKMHQLLPYDKTVQVVEEISFGVLSFNHDDLPYSFGINHIYIDGKLYFHTGQSGYKLNGVDGLASFMIVKDLGINEMKSTHNFNSVYILGELKKVSDPMIRLTFMQKLMNDRAPNNPMQVSEEMIKNLNVLELDIQYMIGKKHQK